MTDQIGTGALASSGKAVVVHYTGWLFDSAAPAVSTERLSLTTQGNIRYRLKTPYRDGTTDVVFEPLDFIARLAALVPTRRVNLTRYHGVFAPNHRLREQVTPARRGRRKTETVNEPAPTPHVSMTWAQR